jgi:hypothetical protein
VRPDFPRGRAPNSISEFGGSGLSEFKAEKRPLALRKLARTSSVDLPVVTLLKDPCRVKLRVLILI